MWEETNKQYYTWQQFDNDVCMLHSMINANFSAPTIILGIARGGACLATALGYKFNIPVVYFDPKRPTKLPVNNVDRFLIVDDINDTGFTLESMRKLIIKTLHPEFTGGDDKIFELSNIRFVTIFNGQNSIFKDNIFIRETNRWVVFPWEEICMSE